MSKYSLPEIHQLRAIKSGREVSYITKAQRISESVLQSVVGKLRVGVSEVALARFIVASFKRRGVKALAFEPIVAFGKGTADIHHWATKTRLKVGDTVMLDFGCTYQGYCSDMTRTYFFGEPTLQQRHVYVSVLAAQERTLEQLAHGERRAGALDTAARTFLTKRFGRLAFPHGLGHGIGTVIHEWPYLKPQSVDVLAPGMVVTVEPGVYQKGRGGVRIEDMVVVEKHGVRNLAHAPKDIASIILRS